MAILQSQDKEDLISVRRARRTIDASLDMMAGLPDPEPGSSDFGNLLKLTVLN